MKRTFMSCATSTAHETTQQGNKKHKKKNKDDVESQYETTRKRLVMHPPESTFKKNSSLATARLARQVHEAAVLVPLPRKNIGVLNSQEISNLGKEPTTNEAKEHMNRTPFHV